VKANPYNRRWRYARAVYLRVHPYCALCAERGMQTIATVVDHRQPHRGNDALFWNRANWQPLCKLCHDAHKQRAEKGFGIVGCDAAGMPRDPAHHWNKPKRVA
jgi:5-methylcytosine-specific restriction endonuclease McrA